MLSKTEAIVVSVASMVLWGSWPNLSKLSGAPWRSQYFYQSLGAFVVLVASAYVLSEDPVAVPRWAVAGLAVSSGFCCGCGVLLLVAAIAADGVYLAVPLSNGLGTALGTLLLYLVERKSHDVEAAWLFTGVALVLFAISANSLSPLLRNDDENFLKEREKRKGGMAATCLLEPPSPPPPERPGLTLAIISGVCFAAWPLFEDLAVLDYDARLGRHFLIPFAIGYLAATALLVFAHDDDDIRLSVRQRLYGLLAGITWGLGAVCLLAAGITLGMAVAVAVAQCNPMIASLYGIALWKELPASAPLIEKATVATSLLLFLLGVLAFFFSTSANLR